MRRWTCSIICVLLCTRIALSVCASGIYTVSIPEKKTISSGSTVTIPVTIEGGSYNVVDMSFSFDPEKLEYASSTLPSDQVTLGRGTIRIRLYGRERKAGDVGFSLSFQSVKLETSEVKITSARVDNSKHALSGNAPQAVISNSSTKIEVQGYSVTLPTGFKGEATAYPGQDYTFSKPAGSGEYYITVKVNGKAVGCKTNADGTYTIPSKFITGAIAVTARAKTGIPGTGGNNNHFVSGKGDSTTGSTNNQADYERLWIGSYVELDNATVFLIAVSGSPKSGMTYAYDGNPMFFTKKYSASNAAIGEAVYVYLQIVKGGEPLLETDVAGKITEIKGTSPTIDADMDIDGSGKIDIKDAQVVYNVYNAVYWDFDDLPMAWFLAADLNLDGIVNVKDADVIIDGRTA